MPANDVVSVEECDADKAIAEMVRVVRPGGHVAICVRACDMNVFWNLPLDAEIKRKAEQPIRQVGPLGCADAGLMGRLMAAGLDNISAYPSLHGSPVPHSYYEPMALAHLDAEETAAWHSAKATAIADGTFCMMHPTHCAIGTESGCRARRNHIPCARMAGMTSFAKRSCARSASSPK